MEDIICSCPYYCDDCEKWHVLHYWAYDDGTYSQCDSDGNHDPCEEDEVPTYKECDDAWYQYAKHVLETGDDNLGEYTIHNEREVTFVAVLADAADGIVVEEIRNGDRRYHDPSRAPKPAREYLQMTKIKGRWRMGDLGCNHCKRPLEEHANGKCLFASSCYEPQRVAKLPQRISDVKIKKDKAYHTFKLRIAGPDWEYRRKLKARVQRHIKEHEKRIHEERFHNAEEDGFPDPPAVSP